jgi:hypothetical protein
MPAAPGPVATTMPGAPVVATPAVAGVATASAIGPPVVNGAFAMPPAKAIQKRRTSLPKEAPPSDVSLQRRACWAREPVPVWTAPLLQCMLILDLTAWRQVPDTVEISVPAGGWKGGEQVIVTLPGEEQQQVRVTISHQTAINAVPGLPFELPVAEGGALYRVELRGGYA